MALRRLKRDGFVRVQPDGHVRLSAAGRKIAQRLSLRHHLIERMLAELFGMEWYKVHDEAERLEHAVSPDFEAKLLAEARGQQALPSRQPQRAGEPWESPPSWTSCSCRKPNPEDITWSAAFTSATGKCWSSWTLAAYGRASTVDLVERNYDQTLSIRTAAGRAVLGRLPAEKIWLSPAR